MPVAKLISLTLATGLVLLAPQAQASEDRCLERAQTQRDLNACAAEAFQRADRQLNASYSRLMQSLATDAARQQLLRQAQRNWLAFRDAECAFAGSVFMGGSAEAMARSACLRSLTRQRTIELDAHLNCGSEEGNSAACANSQPAQR